MPTLVSGLADVRVAAVSTGCEHSAAVTVDGALYTWGHGDGGRLGHGDHAQSPSPRLVECVALMGCRATAVHCGDKFSVALLENLTPLPDESGAAGGSDVTTRSHEDARYSDRWCFDAIGEGLRRLLQREKSPDVTLTGPQLASVLLSFMARAAVLSVPPNPLKLCADGADELQAVSSS